jgi:hypothetical protein
MALTDLLHRCPLCGAEPLEGSGARAHCPACGTGFEMDGRVGGIWLRGRGSDRVVQVGELMADVDRWGREVALSEHHARVLLRTASGQDPIRHRTRLLGFAERFGPPEAGVIGIDNEALSFLPETGGGRRSWRLEEIRSVQASSSSIQFCPADHALVSLKLLEASTRLWEGLICGAIQGIWRSRGWGEIAEFQPRIRAL